MKKYKLFCQNCQYTKYAPSNEPVDLIEHAYSPVPGGLPKINEETKKLQNAKAMERKKRYKCPNCGFLIAAVVLNEAKDVQAS